MDVQFQVKQIKEKKMRPNRILWTRFQNIFFVFFNKCLAIRWISTPILAQQIFSSLSNQFGSIHYGSPFIYNFIFEFYKTRVENSQFLVMGREKLDCFRLYVNSIFFEFVWKHFFLFCWRILWIFIKILKGTKFI